MKRLFVVASMAIMAVGCQKTTVENEVLTPIGFNTEVGKQTRAIVDNAYDQEESFGVYSFAWQKGASLNTVMNNEEIAKRKTSAAGVTPETYAWKAATPYYWPNDANTTLNFYAYSPKSENAVMTTEGTLTLAYNHTQDKINELDFMVATPVIGATFAMPDGKTAAAEADKGKVPMVFNHQMTQIIFKASTNMEGGENGVNFTLKSIKLKNIASEANFTFVYDKTATEHTNYGTWEYTTQGTEYTIYSETAGTVIPYVTSTNNVEPFASTAATMIPQTLNDIVKTGDDITSGQYFEVIYAVSGKGVATETVTKKIALTTTNVPAWVANKKVTYNLTVGLQEITFEPTVAGWETADAGTFPIQ